MTSPLTTPAHYDTTGTAVTEAIFTGMPAARATPDPLRPVRVWLYLLAAMILIMVAIGGITRLTDSGLSIISWKPLSGAIPPLSDADWQAEFEAYQQIPEYQVQNHWMNLDEFKSIFWWEWGHRFFGRLIGLAFAVPFLVFLVQRRLSWRLAPQLALLFVLGGLQGVIGWWMVSSGLTERVDVSQYRLAVHFAAAALLFAAVIHVARRLAPDQPRGTVSSGWQFAVCGLLALIFLQLIAGAFVAGLDAGFGFNTWPLMDGALVPDGLWRLEPAWLNLFENLATVQFAHRMIAYLIAAYALALALGAWRGSRFVGVHAWAGLIGCLVLLQIGLGIATLLLVVPVPLAIAHQAVAFLLVGAVVAYLADMKDVHVVL